MGLLITKGRRTKADAFLLSIADCTFNPTSLVPKPTPVAPLVQDAVLNGSFVAAAVQVKLSALPPLATDGTNTRAVAPVVTNVRLLVTKAKPYETSGTARDTAGQTG